MATPPARFVILETPDWTVYLNEDQGLLGRVYLRLKRTETDVTALTDAELSSLWALSRKIRIALDSLWYPEHFNYAFLMNVEPQVHYHIIPRYKDRREFATGTFVDGQFGKHYSIGPARIVDDTAYDAILTALKSKLA